MCWRFENIISHSNILEIIYHIAHQNEYEWCRLFPSWVWQYSIHFSKNISVFCKRKHFVEIFIFMMVWNNFKFEYYQRIRQFVIAVVKNLNFDLALWYFGGLSMWSTRILKENFLSNSLNLILSNMIIRTVFNFHQKLKVSKIIPHSNIHIKKLTKNWPTNPSYSLQFPHIFRLQPYPTNRYAVWRTSANIIDYISPLPNIKHSRDYPEGVAGNANQK